MGEYELCLGIKAIKNKRYNEALENFSTGAKLSSLGSMFNLCHKLGLETIVDNVKVLRKEILPKYQREHMLPVFVTPGTERI